MGRAIGRRVSSSQTEHHVRRSVPDYDDQLETIKTRFRAQGSLGLIYIEAFSCSAIARQYGQHVANDLLREVEAIIAGMQGSFIRKDDLVTVNHAANEQFLIFLTKKREHRAFFVTDLESLRHRVAHYINDHLQKLHAPFPAIRPSVRVGYAITIHNPLIREDHLIYRLIEDGKKMAEYYEFRRTMRNKEKLQELIIKEEIRTLFQPIVELNTSDLFGYEALARGPAGTEYESPSVLFEMAAEADLLSELDNLCSRCAVKNAVDLPTSARLFINVLPATIYAPGFNVQELRDFFVRHRIDPAQVVIEISEREAITNFDLFRSAMERFGSLGCSIAIDDIGAGYSNLDLAIELRPAFLKLDLLMIRQLHKKPLKQQLVHSIVELAGRMGSKVIAEGIEAVEELEVVQSLGVGYGQGYYFAKPGPPFPTISIPGKGTKHS